MALRPMSRPLSPARPRANRSIFVSWGGALAYTCQLYFDFSAYSDMAIGIARCFGIRFPMNFFSPYKATSIIEFWQRWHITLSRFLRDYVYIGLGGNRRGRARRYLNLMVTMLLGGLWHGANWTFVAWGGLHGLYLIINHAWRSLTDRSPVLGRLNKTPASRALGCGPYIRFGRCGVGVLSIGDFDTAITMLRGWWDCTAPHCQAACVLPYVRSSHFWPSSISSSWTDAAPSS